MTGCDDPDHDAIVTCMRDLTTKQINDAFKEYAVSHRTKVSKAERDTSVFQRIERRDNYRIGFGGSIPCAQTKGALKFYTYDQTPTNILDLHQYDAVPAMFGSNSHEGTFIHGGKIKILMRRPNVKDLYLY